MQFLHVPSVKIDEKHHGYSEGDSAGGLAESYTIASKDTHNNPNRTGRVTLSDDEGF